MRNRSGWTLINALLGAMILLSAARAVHAEVEVDLTSGEGRLNAANALAVSAVPRLRFTSPTVRQTFRTDSAPIEITGTASAGYTLAYAKSWAPKKATDWVPIPPATASAVTDGTLGTWGLTGPPPVFPYPYTLRLEVTASGKKFHVYLPVIIENAPSQLTTDLAQQTAPAISGNRLVWQDTRNSGQPDIYTCLYDPASRQCQSVLRVTTESANQVNPAVSGNRIVWQDYRSGAPDIWLYDVAAIPPLRQLTSDPAVQRYPAIAGNTAGNWIVWEELHADYDIYGCHYDPVTGCTPQRLSNDPGNPALPAAGNQLNAAIAFDGTGYRVVWEDYRNGTADIYLEDPAAPGVAQQLTDVPPVVGEAGIDTQPAITFDSAAGAYRVVWLRQLASSPSGPSIYLYTTGPGAVPQPLSTTPADKKNPAIDGNRIVWQEFSQTTNYDIILCDLGLPQPDREYLTTNDKLQELPAIAGNRIVWADQRNRPATNPQNDDIYLYELSANQPPVANAGADDTVYENTPVTLNGLGSLDPDANPLTYRWNQTLGPLPHVIADNEPSSTPSFTAPSVSD